MYKSAYKFSKNVGILFFTFVFVCCTSFSGVAQVFNPELTMFLTNEQELIISLPIANISLDDVELVYDDEAALILLTYQSNIEENIDKYFKIEIDLTVVTKTKTSPVPLNFSQHTYLSHNSLYAYWRFEPALDKEKLTSISERGNCSLFFDAEKHEFVINLLLSSRTKISYRLTLKEDNYLKLVESIRNNAY